VTVAQEINLLQIDLRAPQSMLSARLVLWAVGALALALVLISSLGARRAADETAAVASLVVQKTQATTRVGELEVEVAAITADPALAAEVGALEIETGMRRALVTAVEKRALGGAQGFSPQLEGLAKRTLSGVWLRQIMIDRGGEGLALSGSALDAELLPRWIEGMRAEAGLAGRAFQTVRIEKRDPKSGAAPGTIDFALATSDESPP
jgi:hypothetical protein